MSPPQIARLSRERTEVVLVLEVRSSHALIRTASDKHLRGKDRTRGGAFAPPPCHLPAILGLASADNYDERIEEMISPRCLQAGAPPGADRIGVSSILASKIANTWHEIAMCARCDQSRRANRVTSMGKLVTTADC